jgi:hypothetical protein
MNHNILISFCCYTEKIAKEIGPPLSSVRIQPSEHKPTESTYTKDFLAGFDPMGVFTFQAAKENELTRSKRHGIHQAIGVAGGAVGGAVAMTPVVAGAVGAAKGFVRSKGGIRQRLGAALSEGASSAIRPFSSIYHGIRAKGALHDIRAGKQLTEGQIDSLRSISSTAKVPIQELLGTHDAAQLISSARPGIEAARGVSRSAARVGDEIISSVRAGSSGVAGAASEAADRAKSMARSDKVRAAGELIGLKAEDLQILLSKDKEYAKEFLQKSVHNLPEALMEARSRMGDIRHGIQPQTTRLSGKIDELSDKYRTTKQQVSLGLESIKDKSKSVSRKGERVAKDIERGEEFAGILKNIAAEKSRGAGSALGVKPQSLSAHESDIEKIISSMSNRKRSELLDRADNIVGSEITGGLSGMAASGLVSGTAAGVQYSSGAQTGKEIREARERALREGAIKAADYRSPRLKDLLIRAARKSIKMRLRLLKEQNENSARS